MNGSGPGERKSPNIALRPATSADAREIADVYLASRKTFLPFAPPAHTDEEVREWIARILIPSGGVTVAVTETGLTGMIAISHGEGCGWIQHLYIHPSSVGRGIGTRLLEHAIKTLGSPVRLYTFQANAGARRFYERHHFRPVAFTDGNANEEKCPDVLYEYQFFGGIAGGAA